MSTPIDFATPTGLLAEADDVILLDGPKIGAPLPDLAYLVPELGMVSRSGPPHLVAGYGFSGKTLALQSLALSLVSGLPVWGAYRCSEARVLHVDFEQGERLTRNRYQRLARAMAVELDEVGSALELAVMPRLALTREHAAQWGRLMTGRGLVIIDSLRAATPGLDENDSGIRSALDMLGEVSERTECRALVIHHARKPMDGAADASRYSIRGSSAIYDASDCAYILSANKGEPIRVAHERAKSHGETVPDLALRITDVILGDNPRWGLAVRACGTQTIDERREAARQEKHDAQARADGEAIRSALARRRSGVPTMELRQLAGLSGTRFHRALAELGEAVAVREERRGKSRAAALHYLREHLPDQAE